MKSSRTFTYVAAAFGALVIVAASSSLATADEIESDGVDVNVSISEIEEPGVLALSIAGNSTTLAENGSTDLVRQFTGALPLVTVVDTRDPEDIPDGAVWSVMGAASAFVNQDDATLPSIGAENLGWSPHLIQGEGESFVSVGGDVETALDGEPGLVNSELLYLTESAAGEEAGGEWSASADLFLRVPATISPGAYTSVMTLSLFE